MGETMERDALDHIMRVAREGIQPTRRLDWIALRAKYALEGKQWSRDVRDDPRNRVAQEGRTNAKLKERVAALEADLDSIARLIESSPGLPLEDPKMADTLPTWTNIIIGIIGAVGNERLDKARALLGDTKQAKGEK